MYIYRIYISLKMEVKPPLQQQCVLDHTRLKGVSWNQENCF